MATNEASQDPTDGSGAGFRAVVEAGTLQSALDAVSVLVDEVRVHLDEDGWRVTAIDPATVGMVDLSLPAEAFESYDATGGTVGLDVGRFESVLGMVDADERVVLDLDPTTRRLHVRVGGLEYTLALVDPGAIREEPDVPDDLDVAAAVGVEGRALARATRAADLVSDHVAFGADPAGTAVLVSAEGDSDDVSLELSGDDLLESRVTDEAESVYSLAYLADMAGALPADCEVAVEFGDDLPLTLRADLPAPSSVTYVLAPRIARGT